MHRRSFLFGLGAVVAAPMIVKASSLMPVKVMNPTLFPEMEFSIEKISVIAKSRALKASWTFVTNEDVEYRYNPIGLVVFPTDKEIKQYAS